VSNLIVETRGSVSVLTINRPERKNAVNDEMWDELRASFERFDHDDAQRVLVITGAGDAFCSGADLSGFRTEDDPAARMARINRAAQRLHDVAKPTVAYVNGVAAGAGCNLALGCDIAMASPTARFTEIFVRRGLSIDFGGSFLLPRLVGMQRAQYLALSGDIIDASRALEFGLVAKITESDQGLDEVLALAERIATAAPKAVTATKALIREGWHASLSEALAAEANSQSVLMVAEDAREALAAFREKREPRFLGR
jgi:2-(1,2-epoxy-1,2-dihydrophenyl)acetyl-CoA isomerase